MDDENIPPTSDAGRAGFMITDTSDDYELMNELLLGQGFDCSDLLQAVGTTGNFMLENYNQTDDAQKSYFPIELQSQLNNQISTSRTTRYSLLSAELEQTKHPSSGTGNIQQRAASASVQQRLSQAIDYIRELHRGDEVLVQIWVPVMQENRRQVLTTNGQPFSLDTNCQRLVSYRSVSTQYHFLADENSHQAEGLPGRVFLNKVPEWTPDVRYFNACEYLRVTAAQQFDVRGTIALPVFERHSRACIGVLEVIMTRQKINYGADVESICRALQAVDLRSSESSSVPQISMTNHTYQSLLPEIQRVLRAACETQRLPLAQTWISCIQQGKAGNRHSEVNFKECISTLDEACYVRDPKMLDFHRACSEHHLFRGQGVAGKAFLTNQPCFSSDITGYSKIEYPLSHHAKMFNLRAAVAIRLRSIHTGKTDFILEFFLPTSCLQLEEHKLMLNSLSITIQQVCQSMRVVTTDELEEEGKTMLEDNKIGTSEKITAKTVTEIGQGSGNKANLLRQNSVEVPPDIPPWISSTMESQIKKSENLLSASGHLEFKRQEIEGLSISRGQWDTADVVVPAGEIFAGFNQHNRESKIDRKASFSSELSFSKLEKSTERKRTKMEKNVNLEELQKYFAGSLKDAAKNLGVCPTTLKRICRQHGISRWPSRKIKKVGHSLKKLQSVIDSVHGPEGAFQLTSLYDNFTKTTWSKNNQDASSSQKQNEPPESANVNQQQEVVFACRTSGSNSLSSSSCSQSSGSSLGCSSKLKKSNNAQESAIKEENSTKDGHSGMHLIVHNKGELQLRTEEIPSPISGSQSRKLIAENLSSESPSLSQKTRNDFLKLKATFGEDKIILRLQPSWSFHELKQELAKRFNIVDMNLVDLKYLDDDSEWVLLTCDADLQECIEIYKLSNVTTVKLSVHYIQPVNRSSFGSAGLSK